MISGDTVTHARRFLPQPSLTLSCLVMVMSCLGAHAQISQNSQTATPGPPAQTPEGTPNRSMDPDAVLRMSVASRLPPFVFEFSEPGTEIPTISMLQALGSALDFNPQALVEATVVDERGGQAEASSGEFDTRILSSARGEASRKGSSIQTRSGTDSEWSASTDNHVDLTETNALASWEAGLARKFRNGIQIEPKVRLETQRQTIGARFLNESTPRLSLDIVIPLGKDAGLAVEAPELAAQFDLLASLYSLRNVTARSLADTAQAYWQALAAAERLRLLRETEAAATRIVAIGEALVQADELPGSQLYQSYADQETATAQRIRSESELVNARLRLATIIGYPPELMDRAPVPKDRFPDPEVSGRDLEIPLRDLWLLALSLRDDVRAARELEKSRKVLLNAARINLRPRVDLRLEGGWDPASSQSTQADYRHSGGIQGAAQLDFEFPFENHFAKGTLIEASALYERSQIGLQDLERSVVAGVVRAWAAIRSSSRQVISLHGAVKQYQKALAVQEEMFVLGLGSLTDTITSRQRLISAQIEYVAAQERYASSIIDLRYESGTLLPMDDQGRGWIESNLWLTPPFSDPPGP